MRTLRRVTGSKKKEILDRRLFHFYKADKKLAIEIALFETLVEDEERHFNQYDDEMENLKKFGDNYLALQSIERSKNIGAGGPTE